MRPRVDWMVHPIDDYILEILDDSDLILSPRIMAVNLDYGRSYVGKRVRELADHDLVERTDQGLYRITEKGRGYLSGELDAEDLEDTSGDS